MVMFLALLPPLVLVLFLDWNVDSGGSSDLDF